MKFPQSARQLTMPCRSVCVCLMLFFALGLHAQTGTSADAKPDETNVSVKDLLARIERLEKQVIELKQQQAQFGVGRPGTELEPGPVAALSPTLPAPSSGAAGSTGTVSTVPGQSAGAAVAPPEPAPVPPEVQETEGSYPNLKIQGFGDVNFRADSAKGSNSTFFLGQLVLHMSSTLSPHINVFTELSFTGSNTDVVAANVERLFIRYERSDLFKVSFGRFHTPINYWNTAYHHGAWLQTTALRPEMIVFGGRVLPNHFVGMLVEGSTPARGLNFHYDAGIGNGRGNPINQTGNFAINNNRAWLVNAYVKPEALGHLRLGGSFYSDKFAVAGSPDYREWIASANLVLERETPEFIAEFAEIHHQPVGTANVFNSQAGYVQLAYRLPWFNRQWKPYYRFEYIHTPLNDLVYQRQPNFLGSILGVRYDISDFAAFKAEYTREQRNPVESNRIIFQTAFTF